MKDTSKLLPIGSVVLLNNGTKTIMITGFYSIAANDKNSVYDYCGCLFPEGVISSDQNLLFNHNQIMKVCFIGYKNDEEKAFKEKLNEIINGTNQAAPAAETPAKQAPVTEVPVANVPTADAPAEAVPENNAPNNTIEETVPVNNAPDNSIQENNAN